MNYDLYILTDEQLSNGKSHVDIARSAYEGGADVVQLRVKDGNDPDVLEWAKTIASISRLHNALFIVNDRIDIALASGANGVHLGQSDVPLRIARTLVPKNFIIGVSVGNVDEAVKAVSEGANYIALSPIFDSTTKNDAGHGHGIEMLKKIRFAVKIPLIAIGGIKKENIPDIIEAGADGIAMISAVVSQPDITKATREMKDLITASKARQ